MVANGRALAAEAPESAELTPFERRYFNGGSASSMTGLVRQCDGIEAMTMQRDEGKTASDAKGTAETEVRHNEAGQRFELTTSAGLAVVNYRRTGDTLLLYYTEVPAPLRGGGIGERLVRGALDEVRRLGLKIVPQCWFVGDVIGRHPEYRDLVSSRR